MDTRQATKIVQSMPTAQLVELANLLASDWRDVQRVKRSAARRWRAQVLAMAVCAVALLAVPFFA